METIVQRPGKGEEVSQSERRIVRLLAGRDGIAITESRYEPGEKGPGLHYHRHHDDAFYVLEGTLVFEADGERVEAPAGTFVLVPPRVVHTFRNEGPGAARFLNFHTPSSGFHDFLRARATATTDAELQAAEALFDSVDAAP